MPFLSIEALKWALDIGEQLGLEPARRLVLIMLGNSADHAGGNLFPSHAFIARRTGLGKSTVRSHVTALHAAGLLIKEPRLRGDGSQTSNTYRLAMTQIGLALEEPPVLDSGRGVPDTGTRGAAERAGGVPAASTLEPKEEKGERKTSGRAAPSPVSLAFKAYQDGIKRKYGTDYPPSRRANGMLSQVVARVGGEAAIAVVDWYLSQGDFYAKVGHKLDFLVRDCEQLCMALQASTGGATPKAPTHARVALLGADERVMRELEEQPAGDMQQIARKAAKDYAGMIARLEPRYVAVRQGADRRLFSVEELRA